MGYIRVVLGENILGVESEGAWATPKAWTELNFGCFEDGSNCKSTATYVDPATKYT